jgi:4-hydroxybutyrate dehydrogenase
LAFIQYIGRIQFDFGALSLLPAELQRLGVTRPLIVTDPGVAACGILARVQAALVPAFPSHEVYDRAPRHPDQPSVRDALELYRARGCDGLVAVGGGAAIDLAKGVALLATHPGTLADYAAHDGGSERIRPGVAPLVAVPTTAGTGSEVGRGAGIAVEPGGEKLVLLSVNLVPPAAIYDPELTLSLPPQVTAGTAVDALSHCIEPFLSRAVNPPVDAIALDGVRRLCRHMARAVRDGSDRQARWDMMMGAMEGGMCFWKGLGPAHALSIPLDTYDLHHGTLVGMLLPASVRMQKDAAPQKYEQLCEALGGDAVTVLQDLNRAIGLPAALSQITAIPRAEFGRIAAQAAASVFNRNAAREGSPADYLAMLEEAWAGPAR